MRCKNCKHWKRENIIDSVIGYCDCDKFVDISDTYSYNKETPIDGLGYGDYEDYKAHFSTGENFGCIHFVI